MEEMQERNNQLEELQNFIESSYESVNDILDALNWDSDHILQKDISSNVVPCPINSQHRVPNERLSKHVTHCKWKNEGYSDSDVPLPEVSEHSNSAIVIDKELQLNILKNLTPKSEGNSTLEVRNVPQTSERLVSDFSCSERLALYDYAVANTMPPAVLKAEELNISYKKDEGTRAKTKLELLMEMRDAKRRRISYRSKKVHTNRKSHVEILREVIQNQMDFLQEINSKETEEDGSTGYSGTDIVKVESDMSEIDIPKWKQDNGDTTNEKRIYEGSAEFSKDGRYDSHEWYTKDKCSSRKRYSEIKDHNRSYRRDAALRYEKYEHGSTNTDASQFLYDDHSDTRSETKRERSTNWHSKRKREKSESSDGENGDSERVRKTESATYHEADFSKHNKHHYHRSKFHSAHESSISRSDTKMKDRMIRIYDNTSTSKYEYGETSKCNSEKQKYHYMKHKDYKLKATRRSFPRSDSESSEFSYGKQTVPEYKTSHTYVSEEEYVHDKEDNISSSHCSRKHAENEKEGLEKKRKHHKKKKKKKSKREEHSTSD